MRRFVAVPLVGFLIACAGLGEKVEDKVRETVAEQAEIGLARSMGVPRSQVSVTPVGDRFDIATPTWDGDCGLGPDARVPGGFPFGEVGNLLADCTVDPDCKELFGFSCGKTDLGLVLSSAGKGDRKGREDARKREIEARGFQVQRTTTKEGATVLTGLKGRMPRAVAVVSTTEQGDVMELLIAPVR